MTARDLQRRDGQWTRGKGFDTFCPLGPWIETELDPADALVACRVNGEMRQMASTREMVFTIPQLITFISSVMTLNPGDVILTGTPAGISPLEDGDFSRGERGRDWRTAQSSWERINFQIKHGPDAKRPGRV